MAPIHLISIIITCAIIIHHTHTLYLDYSVQYECSDSDDRRIVFSDSKSFSAIVLRSSDGQTRSGLKCRVRVEGPQVVGLIVTVTKIWLNSTDCRDYILIGDQHKWCTRDNATSLTARSDHLDIEFVTGTDTTSEFEMIITAVHGIWNQTCPEGTVRCDGGQQFCIYNRLECDGHRNCPSGSDEKDCPAESVVGEGVAKHLHHTSHTTVALPVQLEDNGPTAPTQPVDRKIAWSKLDALFASDTHRSANSNRFVVHVSFTRMALVVTLLLFIIAFIGGIAVCKYRKHYRRRPISSVLRYRPLNSTGLN